MLRIRFAIPAFAAAVALSAAGCGEDGGSSSGSTGLASFAAPGSVVYAEGKLKPKGELRSNVDSVAAIVAGAGSLGELVVGELEDAARADGDTFDYESEVAPWLGEKAGVSFERIEKDGDLSEPLIAIQTTDEAATRKFIEARASGGAQPYKSSSYEGIQIEIGGSEQNAIGVFDGALVIADDEAAFKAAVDASGGDSLGGEARFADAIAAASIASFADVYIDVGAIIEQSDDRIDDQTQEALEGAGIDPSEATAVASVIPGAEEVEVELSSDLDGEKAPSGDVSALLGSLPADSFAAFAVSGFGAQLEEAVDNIDESGLGSELPPGELKSTLKQAGIDLDKVAASIEDAAVFAEGSDLGSLAGALVLSAEESGEASKAVTQIGTLLRGARIPGITAVKGQAAGFSIRSPELGGKPIVVVAKGDRIAVGYGLAQALEGLSGGSGPSLSGTATYKAAVASLGKTPISAFVDGPAALRLANSLVPRSETGYFEARPYLRKIAYLALGAGEQDELATAKLIVGLAK